MESTYHTMMIGIFLHILSQALMKVKVLGSHLHYTIVDIIQTLKQKQFLICTKVVRWNGYQDISLNLSDKLKKSSLRVGFFILFLFKNNKIFISYVFKRESKIFILCILKRECKIKFLFYICSNENVSHSTSPMVRCAQGTPGGRTSSSLSNPVPFS